MGENWLGRVAIAAGAVLAVGLSTAVPALADSTIGINPGNVPTTAAGYGNHDCDFGGGPFADKDVWVFVLPGNEDTAGDFVSVTATFGANGTLTIPTDGGAIVTDTGTSKAWITTPAGWTLTAATAVITGTAAKFNLTHTCPGGGGGETPSPSPTPSGSASPTTPTTTAPGTSISGTPGGGGGESGGLPVTGTAVTGMVVVGGALVAGGIALLALRRRRDELAFSAGDSSDS